VTNDWIGKLQEARPDCFHRVIFLCMTSDELIARNVAKGLWQPDVSTLHRDMIGIYEIVQRQSGSGIPIEYVNAGTPHFARLDGFAIEP